MVPPRTFYRSTFTRYSGRLPKLIRRPRMVTAVTGESFARRDRGFVLRAPTAR